MKTPIEKLCDPSPMTIVEAIEMLQRHERQLGDRELPDDVTHQLKCLDFIYTNEVNDES